MDEIKEVYFGKYCISCKYKDNSEEDEPCFDCLSVPSNVDSHKPVRYKEK